MNENIEHLKFQIIKIRQTLKIFKETRSQFLNAMDINSSTNPNRLGRLERILKEYIVIKVAALTDKNKNTFSLLNLQDNRVLEIVRKYKQMNKIIKTNRDKAFGHHEKKFIMTREIIGDEDLLDLPIEAFLKDIEKVFNA